VTTTSRPIIFAVGAGLALIALILIIFLASGSCGDDDDETGSVPGQLTDPQTVATATPWATAPEVIVLDPENIQPLPPSQPSDGSASPTPAAGEPGVCGETYIVEAGDTTFGIAEKCGVSVDAIEAANPDIDIRSLTIGQEINMPAAEE
jgi:LysM repeat protein